MRATGLLALFLFAALVLAGCDATGAISPPPRLPSASLGSPGEEVRIRGRVIENRNKMPVDGPGLLRIDLGGEEAEVVYGYGEWPPCPNDRVIGLGVSLRSGERVEVFGVIGEGGEVNTCDSEAYYIQRL